MFGKEEIRRVPRRRVSLPSMAVNATRQELVTDMSWIRTATDLIAGTLAGLTSLVFALTFLFIKEISGYLLSLKFF